MTGWTQRMVLFLPTTLLLATFAQAGTTTIDDSSSAVTYNPAPNAGWNTQDCPATECSAKPPSTSQIKDGTWHDILILPGATPASLQLSFTGIGVTVFGMHVGSTQTDLPWKNQDLSFSIDGASVGHYVFNPSGSNWDYNVQYLAASGLPNGQHILTMTVNAGSIALVDYFQVITQDAIQAPPPPPQQQQNNPPPPPQQQQQQQQPSQTTPKSNPNIPQPPSNPTVTLTVGGKPTVVVINQPSGAPTSNSPSQSVKLSAGSQASVLSSPNQSPTMGIPANGATQSSLTPSSSQGNNVAAGDTSTSSFSSHGRTNLIIGLVVGLCCLLFIGLIAVWWRKRSKRRRIQLQRQSAQPWSPLTPWSPLARTLPGSDTIRLSANTDSQNRNPKGIMSMIQRVPTPPSSNTHSNSVSQRSQYRTPVQHIDSGQRVLSMSEYTHPTELEEIPPIYTDK